MTTPKHTHFTTSDSDFKSAQWEDARKTLCGAVHGLIIARAAQTYGIYVVDRGGDGGITIKAELNAPDATFPDSWKDANIVTKLLQQVTNNGPASTGGETDTTH